MLNQGLVSYIYTNLQKGYDLTTLRNFLYSKGYSIQDIDDSIRHIQTYYPDIFHPNAPQTVPSHQTTVHHKVSLTHGTLFIIVFLLVLLPGGIYFGFKILDGSPSKLLDIKTEPLTPEVKAGEDLMFTISLISFGSDKRFDTTITLQIVDSSGDIINEKQVVKAVETQSSEVYSLRVPSDTREGRYRLISTLRYKGIEEETSFLFSVSASTVVHKPSCFDGIKNGDETGIDCGGSCKPCASETKQPSCSDGIRNQGETKIDCGGPCPPCKVSCENCIPISPCTDAACINSECVYKPITPCCGNFYCEPTESHETCPADCAKPVTRPPQTSVEIKRAARDLASSDVEAAARLCDSIKEEKTKDECFRDVSQESKESNLCSYIQDPAIKDSCYMNAVMLEDYSVCDKILDRHLQSTCNQLKQIAGMTRPDTI